MNQTRYANTLPRAGQTLAVAFAVAFALAAPAWASVTSEQQEGAQVQSAVREGRLKTSNLTSSQYERVGEHLMGQALGSTASHERMNSLMAQMTGSPAVDQMHVYLGERYFGKSTQIPGRYASMYGLAGMMTGYRGTPIAGMMSGYLNSHAQSQSTGPHPGTGMMSAYGTQPSANSTGGWPTGAIVATAVLAALLLSGVLALGVPMLRRRGGGQPTNGPASTPVG